MRTTRTPQFSGAATAAVVGFGLVALVGLVAWTPEAHGFAHAPTESVPEAVSYASDIDPIFQASCVQCHGGEYDGEPRLEASLNLTTYEGVMAGSEFGSVVEPGDPDGSILLEMVAVGDMPEEGDPLTPEQIEAIRTWIAEGAQNN